MVLNFSSSSLKDKWRYHGTNAKYIVIVERIISGKSQAYSSINSAHFFVATNVIPDFNTIKKE